MSRTAQEHSSSEKAPGPGIKSWPPGSAGRDPHVVSVPEAARLLGISKDLGYDLSRRGSYPAPSSWGGAGG